MKGKRDLKDLTINDVQSISDEFVEKQQVLPPPELVGVHWGALEREFFIDILLVRNHFIIVMIRWTGLAPWEFEFPFPGSLTSDPIRPLESPTHWSNPRTSPRRGECRGTSLIRKRPYPRTTTGP